MKGQDIICGLELRDSYKSDLVGVRVSQGALVVNVSVMRAYISTICCSSKALLDRVELRDKSLRSGGINLHFFLRFTHFSFYMRFSEFIAKQVMIVVSGGQLVLGSRVIIG